ncbi:LacI family transcriptional regulator [Solihabitans fulvus]|uniref:LacI family transcriptional regulator n=1 Tax=Solihabitans fulvus TaxID=1892852 RepID=A0A5B2WP11_9PSEU|nr:LacI family DNA-binding transcriptional regulator [Solihabitans fulvus]KAA2252236.1 LacI family transcriptional regulator [Solihabitans fulvus]
MSVVELPAVRPTLADVACAAGVSVATASRVLNGFPGVRPETRTQVESAMTTLGYARQRAARSATPPCTGSIALIVCEDVLRLFADPYFARVVSGVSKELPNAGMQLVLLAVPSTEDHRTWVARYLKGRHVDGALVVSMHGRRPLDLDWLDIPLVFGGRPDNGEVPDRHSYVDVDNRGGAEGATRYLIGAGRTKVATVAGPQDMTVGADRLRGYWQAVVEAGRPDRGMVVFGDFGQGSGEHATARLLDRRPDVDAIFTASDLMAVGVLRALRRAGRRVPDDVAVIGFDGLPLGQRTAPPLTTVRQPIEEMGARMTRELVSMIGGPATPRRVVLDTELVVREST